MTMTKQALEGVLGTLPLSSFKYEVESHGSRFTIHIESGDFSTMDEADRQKLVWDHLNANFNDDELVKIKDTILTSGCSQVCSTLETLRKAKRQMVEAQERLDQERNAMAPPEWAFTRGKEDLVIMSKPCAVLGSVRELRLDDKDVLISEFVPTYGGPGRDNGPRIRISVEALEAFIERLKEEKS